MDYSLVQSVDNDTLAVLNVLILVVMDYSLVLFIVTETLTELGLNPCCNGL